MSEENEFDLQERCSNLVRNEVYACISSIIHPLASNAHDVPRGDLADLCEEAQEAFTPTVGDTEREEVLDYNDYRLIEITDETALADVPWLKEAMEDHKEAPEENPLPDDPDLGWYWYDPTDPDDHSDAFDTKSEALSDYIEEKHLESEAQEAAGEIYEHWIVSGWLGNRLRGAGHTVVEVGGLTVWGRPTTGQAISMDGVIRGIVRDLHR